MDPGLGWWQLKIFSTCLASITINIPYRNLVQRLIKSAARHHDNGPDMNIRTTLRIPSPSTELYFALTCGALLGIGVVVERWWTSAPGGVPLAMYVLAYAFGGTFTMGDAIKNLRERRLEIDSLMLVAAAERPHWAHGPKALSCSFCSVSVMRSNISQWAAQSAIEALADLAPKTAWVRRKGEVIEIAVLELAVGDEVLVKPNARLPADGFVIKEPQPSTKRP